MEKLKNFCNKNYAKILFTVILLVAIFVRTFNVSKLPYGLNVDEAGMAYDAYSIANYGVDRCLDRYPVHLTNYGVGQSSLYAYLTSIFIKIFGLNMITIRLPAILLGIIAVILSYFIARKSHSDKFALTFMALVAICPWTIMASRFGLDCNLLSAMNIISIFFLTRAEKTWHYVLSGIFIGLTLYSYAISWLIIPLFLVFALVYMIRVGKLNLKKIIALGIPIFILALPLMLFIAVNYDIIPEINSFITISKLPGWRGGEVSFKNISLNFMYVISLFTHDEWVYNSTPEFGTVYYISIPLILIGFIIAMKNLINNMKNKKYDTGMLLLLLFISSILCMFIIEMPNANRGNALFIPMLYLVCIALRFIYNESVKIFNLFVLAYLVFFISFIVFYFNIYSIKYPLLPFFENDLVETISYVSEKYPDSKISMNKCYIYTILAEEMSPYEYNQLLKTSVEYNSLGRYYFDTSGIRRDSVYILNNDDGKVDELLNAGFESEDYSIYKIMVCNEE